ncbi:MAG: sugar transferase [Planctomycetes bacterium]|nr:sugar transferase [Planctomycetota bacterium]
MVPLTHRSRFTLVFTICMALGDALAVVLGFAFAVQIYMSERLSWIWQRGPHDAEIYVYIATATALGLLTMLALTRSYDQNASVLNIDEVTAVARSLLVVALTLFAVTFAFRDFSISRLVLGLSLVHTGILLAASRMGLRRLSRWLHARGIGVSRVAIYGAGATGQLLARRMWDAPAHGLLPVCFIDDTPDVQGQVIGIGEDKAIGIPVAGGQAQLRTVAVGYALEEVILAIPDIALERLHEIIEFVKSLGLGVKYVALVSHVPFRAASFESLGEFPLVGERQVRPNWMFRTLKRAVDILISAAVLSIFGLPMIIIAALVKITSPGPALFVQERVGKNGRLFRIFKFRSMRTDAPKYAITPQSADDPRITAVGRFLRKTSLDELPQFFNVLAGDMSIVGPRPEMPFIVEKYTLTQRARLLVRPGITGLWQISADRKNPIHENLDYDFYYIQNQSLLMDLMIIIQTLFYAFRGI